MKSAGDDALLAAWQATREQLGSATAIFDTTAEPVRTFAEVEAEAKHIEDEFLAGSAAGEVVAIQLGNHAAWPAALLACLRRRVVALPLERSIGEADRAAAIETCRVSRVIRLEAGEIASERIASRAPVQWDGPPPSLLKLTSGTTAAPRAICFRSEQLLADCAQICETMGLTNRDLNYAVIPVSHSYGFSNLITPLIARGVPMVLSRDRMPRAVLDGMVRTEATVFPGMPVFYQAFCEMEDVPPLPALRLCISAGAPLQIEVARKFRAKFGRTIHSFYGSSECGGICYDRVGALLDDGFVGEPMSGVELEVLEPDLPSSRVSVHSAAVGDGYFPDPDEEKLGHGRFMPDDLLTRTADGYRVVGRVSDVINVAGKKVNPAEVEAELLRFSGVRAAAVFARESTLRNEEVAACVVAEANVTESALLEHCHLRLSGWQVPKRIFFVDEIPVNDRGKISRRALAQQFRS